MSSDEPGARRASCSRQHLALNKAGKSRTEPPCSPALPAFAGAVAGSRRRWQQPGCVPWPGDTRAAGAADAEPCGGSQPAPDSGRNSELTSGPPPGCILQIPAGPRGRARSCGSMCSCGNAAPVSAAAPALAPEPGQLTEQRSALF